MRLTLKNNPSALSQNSSLEYEQLLVFLRSEVAITKKGAFMPVESVYTFLLEVWFENSRISGFRNLGILSM